MKTPEDRGAPGPDDPRVARLGELVEALAGHPDPAVGRAVAELVGGVRWLHEAALRRLTELLAEDADRFRRALDDPLVSNLLLLYDLVAIDERERAIEALESLRPFLRSHGGEVELLGVEDGVVRLRLLGACHGCPSSTATLRQGIERALAERLPGFLGIEVVGAVAAPAAGSTAKPGLDGADHRATRERRGEPVSFVPVDKLLLLERRAGSADGPDWKPRAATVGPLDDLAPGVLHGFLVENYPILVARHDGGVTAYQNTCPGSILPLHLGRLEDGVLVCPWHGCRFDLADGRRVDREGSPLHRLDVVIEGGLVRVAIR